MSSMNGVLSPPTIIDTVTSTISLSSKRKREDNALDLESVAPPEMSPAESQALINDLIDVLKADDTTPSILTRSLPEHSQPGSPNPKRPKTGDISELRTSILCRQSSNAYNNVDEVLYDIDAAVNEIIDKLEIPNSVIQNQCTAISRPPSELSIKITAFSKRAHDLVRRGKASWQRSRAKNRVSNSDEAFHNYPRVSGYDDHSHDSFNSQGERLVLTLLGNAPTPKQLFSSFQQPTKVNSSEEEVIIPIREAGLPNGIITTRIITSNPSRLTENKKRPQTIGEIFPTPPNVTPSIPPKPSTIATTKSSTVGWYHPTTLRNASRNLSYFNQGISSGLWIDYSKTSNTSRVNRVKNRDRTLDLEINKSLSTESEAERLESLFRSAYSSFAPTRDNSAAIAPTGCLDRMWWREVGEKSFNRIIHNSNNNSSIDTIAPPGQKELGNDLEVFEKGLEELQKNAIDPELEVSTFNSEKSISEKGISEVLNEISGLLETLTSHQRIRHSSLNISNRSTGIYSSSEINSLGTPLKPNGSEFATYEILKSQLSLIISNLPPYAVAKINSDRLADLGISSKIEVRLNDYKGVMEEYESSTRTPKTTASAISSMPSPRPSSQFSNRGISGNNNLNTHFGNQFASSQSRGATAQYYNSTQTPIRPPSSSTQRSAVTMSGPYQTQRASSTTSYRPNTYGMSSYSHQNPRSVQKPYSSSGQNVNYSQTSTSQGNLRAPIQSYHHQHASQSATQTAMSSRYSSSSTHQPTSPAQSSLNGVDSKRLGNSHQIPNQASTQKAIYSPQATATQPLANKSTQISAVSQRSQVLNSTVGKPGLINGPLSRSSHSPHNQQATAIGSIGITQQFSTFLTHEQQQTLIQRQQAALANQHQTNQDGTKKLAQTTIS